MPNFTTNRLNIHALERQSVSPSSAVRVMLLHGNVSSSAFFAPLMAQLPAHWHVIAPDLRGYGASEAKPIDATRGAGDWADDLWALCETLGWKDFGASARLEHGRRSGNAICARSSDSRLEPDACLPEQPLRFWWHARRERFTQRQ